LRCEVFKEQEENKPFIWLIPSKLNSMLFNQIEISGVPTSGHS
jgi:hypothetical protein